MSILLGANGVKTVKEIYIGVDGKPRKVKEGYVGAGGAVRKFYSAVSPKLASQYAVGEHIKLSISGKLKDFIIVHQGIPSSLYDASCNGTWVTLYSEFDLDIDMRYSTSVVMNDYANSHANTVLNSDFFESLSPDAQKIVKLVKIPYRPGNGTSTEVSARGSGLSTKVFCFSSSELGFPTSLFNTPLPVDGSKLDYFLSGDSDDANSRRMWGSTYVLRTPCTGTMDFPVCYCHRNTGALNNAAGTYSYLIARPVMILDSSAVFDGNTNELIV